MLSPLTIELALKALTSLEERVEATAAQWRRRIDRARYDADLAERRYEAVDPHNRLVASTLEQRWNDEAQRVLELETEFANFERQALRTITGEQKQQILQLVSDFPRLWTAPTTEPRDRKRMLRLLFARGTASACMSSTTGLYAVTYPLNRESRGRLMP